MLSGSNQYSVSDKVICGGVKIQKRDIETGKAKPQGSGTLEGAVFTITTLNDNPVLVDGKSYTKDQVVLTLTTDKSGIAATASATANINESIRLTFLIKHKTKTMADIIIIPIASLPLN